MALEVAVQLQPAGGRPRHYSDEHDRRCGTHTVLNTLGIARRSGASAGRSAGACVERSPEQDHRREAAGPRVRGVAGRRPVVGQMTDERGGYRR